MQSITRTQAERKLQEDSRVVLVEALPESSFREFHLPGAVNLPADADDFAGQAEEKIPDKTTPVIVYCQNTACDASPKAARRLEALGYGEIYDYEAGKDDWKQAGNEIEAA
jgi:rhodanese-related sulfurtransferase